MNDHDLLLQILARLESIERRIGGEAQVGQNDLFASYMAGGLEAASEVTRAAGNASRRKKMTMMRRS